MAAIPSKADDLPSIIIVEDDPSFRSLLSMAIDLRTDMKLMGSYSSGQEVLDQINEALPDIIVADYSMPGISGLELLLKVKEKCPNIRYVLLSGHAEKEYAVNSLAAGADGYILKGKPKEIIEGIVATLNGERFVSPKVNGAL